VQIKAHCRSGGVLGMPLCFALAVDAFGGFLFRRDRRACSGGIPLNDKRNGAILLWGEGNMHRDGMLTHDQRTYPHDVAEVQVARLWHRIGTESLSHSSTCHLQVSHPWHDALPGDHMIGQEKLITVKG